MSFIMGGQPSGLQRNLEFPICLLCNNYHCEDCYHVLFYCNASNETHEVYLSRLHDVMPQSMANEMNQMTIRDKVRFLLSPLQSSYIPEWNNIYVAIASFIFAMYPQKASMYDEINLAYSSV